LFSGFKLNIIVVMKIKITINIEKLEYDRAYPQWNAAELTTLTVRKSQINM